MTLDVYWSERGVRDGSSPGLSYAWKGPNAGSKQISVQWADRFTAMRQLVGYSYPQGAGASRKLRREIPEPYMPQDTDLFCTTARLIRGETWTGRAAYNRNTYALVDGYPKKDPNPVPGGDTLWKANEFEEGVIDCTYGPADFYLRTDGDIDTNWGGNELARFTSYREDRQVKGLVLQGGTMNWIISDGQTQSIPYGVPRLEFTKTVYVKWHQVAVDAIPWNTIDAMIGKINKTTFLGIYPPDTLLMMAPRTERYVMANGLIGADLEFCYEYTPNLQPKLLYSQAGSAIGWKWVTTQTGASAVTPTPGSLPDNTFLFNEDEFAKCFFPSNP